LNLSNDNRWHLGTCVPQDLLGPGGYLPTRQSKIEDLSLLTSDPCILPKRDWEWQMSLTHFKSLKTFSWSGGLSREDFHELRDMFRSQASKLEVLKIDLLDWWDALWNWCMEDYDLQLWTRENNFFAERVLETVPGLTNVLFPSLKSLTLSSVDFQYASLEMAHAFNFSNLNSLNLRDCPHTGSLLRKVVESGEPINLQSLELVIQHRNHDEPHQGEEESWVIRFINSFEGLRSLYLLILNRKRAATKHKYWPSILHHRKTLGRLVYHEQVYESYWQLDCNISIEDKNTLDAFTQMNLECIGLCHCPTPPMVPSPGDLALAPKDSIQEVNN
jgi:hypothetical protein